MKLSISTGLKNVLVNVPLDCTSSMNLALFNKAEEICWPNRWAVVITELQADTPHRCHQESAIAGAHKEGEARIGFYVLMDLIYKTKL
jgi:hypothetical protein